MTIDVLLLEGVHDSAAELLQTLPGLVVRRLPHAPPAAELAPMLEHVQVLGLRSRTVLSRELLAAAPHLRAVGAYCTGTNNLDLVAATERGVAVFNGPFSNTRSVAELVIGHAIHLLRRVPERHAAARRGLWLKDSHWSNEVRGKTLGVVGYGKIGSQAGLLAEALGMSVQFHDIEARLPLGNARATGTLAELLAAADVVTLHVPQSGPTQHLIDDRALARMKPGAVLINLARGQAVDLEALQAALRAGHLRGAALDVFPEEPASAAAEFVSPLRELDNVILTPHVGGSTIEAQRKLGIEVSEKLRDHLSLGAVRGSVNLPELAAGPLRSPMRVLHLHRDRPGVMSRVNAALVGAGLNVTQLHLATGGGLGLALTDVDAPLPAAVAEALRQVPGTLRVELIAAAGAGPGEVAGLRPRPRRALAVD